VTKGARKQGLIMFAPLVACQPRPARSACRARGRIGSHTWGRYAGREGH